jgi:hypothetical protein
VDRNVFVDDINSTRCEKEGRTIEVSDLELMRSLLTLRDNSLQSVSKFCINPPFREYQAGPLCLLSRIVNQDLAGDTRPPHVKNLTAQLDLHLSPLALCRAIKMIASYKVLAYISSVCILRHIARGRCSIIDGNFSPVFSRATSSLRRRFSLPPPIHCNGRLSMKCSFSTLRVSWPSSVITSYTTSNS